jgi:hypothetical protein
MAFSPIHGATTILFVRVALFLLADRGARVARWWPDRVRQSRRVGKSSDPGYIHDRSRQRVMVRIQIYLS